eukprot:jgi/Tetstr1/449236/TSEL_036441.t1
MSMETAVPIDFRQAWAEARRCVNKRVVEAVEADDPAFVTPVKKPGEGGATDVWPVAVREAEWRAAERAVVDNVKEAYVSVLAPSQLGVDIYAWDSALIHGVSLIAEKLGPRAVIVHTDLRNAYNEAWRRTIIQRHIDCSPLHFVIIALPASLSTDSFLRVDDQSTALRSEDGVQHGAPLATTSFCVAIQPELEARFDKIQAHGADMEAARREAPTEIRCPELDGHHGIPVRNVLLGSHGCVHAYMRGKAEEIQEEVDTSLSKLLSAKLSRRYSHAMHHHAWAMLKHCMHHMAGYWLRNCLPSEVEDFLGAVMDATVLMAVELVLGLSFYPSTPGRCAMREAASKRLLLATSVMRMPA